MNASDRIHSGVRPSRVTITDVADALGLSKGTVSRALNNYPDISDATRQRVRRKAETMGYRPLAQAQAIRTGRTRTIGLVLQTDIAGAQRPFLSEFLAGATTAASSESWTLTVATAGGEQEMLKTLERLVSEHKADGFILPRTYEVDARAAFLLEQNVPFVLFGRVRDDTGCAWFDILGEEAMKEAVARLVQHGHSRIAFVNGGAEYNFSHLREAGFRAGMAQAGLEVDEMLVACRAMTREAGASATAELLSQARPPTAIVFAVDMGALGAYDAAEATGLEIGVDLSVISYDGIPECDWVRPRLSTFRVDSRMAGERLARLLIRRIRGEAPEALRETGLAMLSPGGSDGRPEKTSEELALHLESLGEPVKSLVSLGGKHD